MVFQGAGLEGGMVQRTGLIVIGAMLLWWAGPIGAPAAESYRFVTFHFPPLEYTTDGEQAEGIAVDIVREVMRALGHDVTITVYPWTRALRMATEGSADAIFTAYRNAERERYLDFSNEVLFPQVVYFYARRDAHITFDGQLESLSGRRIGVVSTISYGQRFDRAKTGLMIDKARELEHNFKKLLLDRIDLVPSNIYVAEYTLAQLGWGDQITRLPHPIERLPSYIAFSKKRGLETLRDRFDTQLAKMKASGAYEAIISQYNVQLLESQ
jgi:polar amino acid transport system substrate-binding protein